MVSSYKDIIHKTINVNTMKKLLFLFLNMLSFCSLYSEDNATTKPTHSTNNSTKTQQVKNGTIIEVTVTRVEADGTIKKFPLAHNCIKVANDGTGKFIESPSYYYATTSATSLACLVVGLAIGFLVGKRDTKSP